MHNLLNKMIFGLISIVISLSSFAADKVGTPEQAQAMVKAAIVFYKEVGKEKALAEFNSPKGRFRENDLYVFVYDHAGVSLAHINPKMVGRNLIGLRDPDNLYINREFIKLGDSKEGHGWLNYRWINPISQAVEKKKSYVEKFDGIYFMCGAYVAN